MFDNYDYFKSEFKKYNDHNWSNDVFNYKVPSATVLGGNSDVIFHPFGQKDMVNSPGHYTRGSQEAIDIIEEAIQDAPDVKAGMLQAQALKYMLRLWLKGNAPQDAEKAQWYLTRLIDHLQREE